MRPQGWVARKGKVNMLDLQTIIDELIAFRDERDWLQFHNPKDLAVAISIEAAELLEVFRWSGEDMSAEGREKKVKEELADVLIYCLYLADVIGVNPLEAIEDKINVNSGKYPAEKSRGNARKYTEL